MAKKYKEYETILDELEALFKEQGHSVQKASFDSDRITFSGTKIREAQFKANQRMKQLNQTPIGRHTEVDSTPPPDKERSKQVELPASSTIQSAAYWPTKEYLLVSFKSGHTYSYTDVPQATIDLWEWASSAGSFFYYNIRMTYKYLKMG